MKKNRRDPGQQSRAHHKARKAPARKAARAILEAKIAELQQKRVKAAQSRRAGLDTRIAALVAQL